MQKLLLSKFCRQRESVNDVEEKVIPFHLHYRFQVRFTGFWFCFLFFFLQLVLGV
jgi:hypothetical protein